MRAARFRLARDPDRSFARKLAQRCHAAQKSGEAAEMSAALQALGHSLTWFSLCGTFDERTHVPRNANARLRAALIREHFVELHATLGSEKAKQKLAKDYQLSERRIETIIAGAVPK